ncbi:hypothetical protein [Rhizobium phage RHph_X2_26]|nr:hypothetical protein [Rhizobium phage RHph_X2_26]
MLKAWVLVVMMAGSDEPVKMVAFEGGADWAFCQQVAEAIDGQTAGALHARCDPQEREFDVAATE